MVETRAHWILPVCFGSACGYANKVKLECIFSIPMWVHNDSFLFLNRWIAVLNKTAASQETCLKLVYNVSHSAVQHRIHQFAVLFVQLILIPDQTLFVWSVVLWTCGECIRRNWKYRTCNVIFCQCDIQQYNFWTILQCLLLQNRSPIVLSSQRGHILEIFFLWPL